MSIPRKCQARHVRRDLRHNVVAVSRFRLLLLVLSLAAPAFGKPLVVHVTVALCDNATQGIVPVPPAIGDGNDPRTNLYWGASYGVKSQLKREKWTVEKVK